MISEEYRNDQSELDSTFSIIFYLLDSLFMKAEALVHFK